MRPLACSLTKMAVGSNTSSHPVNKKASENNTQTKRAMLGLRQCHNATSQLANGGGRYERAMSRFRRMRSLQKFASIHSSVYNHFNHQRNIESRAKLKSLRDAALREWRDLLVA